MWFRFRNQILTVMALVALVGVGYAAWQFAAPEAEKTATPRPSAPTSTVPVVAETIATTTAPTSTIPIVAPGGPSYLDLEAVEVAAVNEMLQRAAAMEDLETITGSVDEPIYMLGVFEQFRDAGGTEFPDAEVTIGDPRPGTTQECGEDICAAIDITISVPSLAYSNTLPIIAQRADGSWALTRSSLCAIAEVAGITCPPVDTDTTTETSE